MKNSKLRRILMLLASAVLLVSLSVGATLAYLTSVTGVVENTFTVGNVEITLDELYVDEYGEKGVPQKVVDEDGNEVTDEEGNVVMAERVNANKYKLIPGHTYIKDPTVHVQVGSEICYLFVEVVNEIADIEADTTIAAQMKANGWNPVEGYPGIYSYGTTVDALEETKNIPVFASFTLKTDAEVEDYVTKKITIKAYAIQADGFETSNFVQIWEALDAQEAN